jgi:hypothetical protein
MAPLSMPAPLPRVEPLEDRIAPAQIFLSSTTFAAVDKDDNPVSDTTIAGLTGAGLAIHLNKGDLVVFDTNGNRVLDLGETVYAKILAAKAILFATDIDGTAGVGDGDITGLAVSTGFNATITGSVHGPVTTAVTADGSFVTTQLVPGTIVGLTVSGNITGKLLAGGSISNVNLGSIAGAQSVQEIRAGSAVDGEMVSYNGTAGVVQALTPALAPGAAGASISKVKLAVGASLIQAGDGIDSSTAAGGKGGGISGITFLESPTVFDIAAGKGGSSTKFGSKGGAGGSVSGVNITTSKVGAAGDSSHVKGGTGGNGDTAGNGGSVSGGTFHVTSATNAYFYVYGGKAGAGLVGGRASKGGNGGSVSKTTFTADAAVGFAGFYGGVGGNAAAGTNGKGGTGGGVSSVTYQALGGLYAPDFQAGKGGNGAGKGAGGNGGSLSKLTITQGDTMNDQQILGGEGGTSETGKAGNGGSIAGLKLTAGTTEKDIAISAGKGGTSTSGAGGNGGSVGGASTLTLGDMNGSLRAESGAGGNSTNGKGGNAGAFTSFAASISDTGINGAKFLSGKGGNGGRGGGAAGAISRVSATLNGTTAGFVSVYSGAGGSGTTGDTRGGNGGAVSSITVNKQAGVAEFISVFSGNGGGSSGTGGAGNGGAVSKVTYHGLVAANFLYVGSGNGGDAPGDGARGGNGGTVSSILLDARVAFSEAAVIYGGDGGIAGGDGGKGGNGGNVSALKFAAPNSLVRINNSSSLGNPTGGAGGTGLDSTGGKGGSVSGLSGELGVLVAIAQRGGSSDSVGGAGGSVTGVNLKIVNQFVQLLAGGVGGDAVAGGTAGRGGSVSNIKLPATAAIGNFSAAFNVDPANTPDAMTPGMGGIVAGKAGLNGVDFDVTLNGSVTNVTAQKIAAIIAGNVYNPGGVFDGTRFNTLSVTNAVSKISGLKVQVIGADTGAPGFTFNNNPMSPSSDYELDANDGAIDGLVIVLAAKGKFPVPPLKLFEVPVP